jgi:hypothetical protein
MIAAFAIGVHWSSFFAAGPDASGYVSQSAMWLRGELTWQAPAWVNDATWNDAAASAAPVGYRPGPATQTIVPTYPPGFPLLMSGFQLIGGPDAAFYVVPVCGAVAVWGAYILGAFFAGGAAGLAACVLLLSSPAFLIMLVQAMSDVPAAALWILALVAARGASAPRAAAAGLATCAAILVRPNLAPLSLVPLALVVVHTSSGRQRIVRALAFVGAISPAVIGLAALNRHLHGSALRSGYGEMANLYDMHRVLPNLASYGAALIGTQTPLVLLAAGAPFLVSGQRRREALLITVVFPLLVLALYLPYERFTVWWFLRFLLPAYPALAAGTAAALVLLLSRIPRAHVRGAALTLVVIGVAVHGVLRARSEGVFGIRDADRRYQAAVEYARGLPPQSVLVSLLHSGTLHYYTGRDVLRWDTVDGPSLERAVGHIADRGYEVYLFLDPGERDAFNERFAGTAVAAQVTPERAVHLRGDVLVYRLLSASGHETVAVHSGAGRPNQIHAM